MTAPGTLTRKARRNRPALPLEAETELHHTLGAPGLDDLAGVGLAPVDTRPAGVLRNTEVGMVHRVENFSTEPGPEFFTDVEALPQRQIHVDEIRSPALVPGDRGARKRVLEVLPAHAGSGLGAAFDREHPIVFALLQTERHVAHQVGNGPAEESDRSTNSPRGKASVGSSLGARSIAFNRSIDLLNPGCPTVLDRPLDASAAASRAKRRQTAS